MRVEAKDSDERDIDVARAGTVDVAATLTAILAGRRSGKRSEVQIVRGRVAIAIWVAIEVCALPADARPGSVAGHRYRQRRAGRSAINHADAPVRGNRAQQAAIELRCLIPAREIEHVAPVCSTGTVVVIDVIRVDITGIHVWCSATLRGVSLTLRQRVVRVDADSAGTAAPHAQQHPAIRLLTQGGVLVNRTKIFAGLPALHGDLAAEIERGCRRARIERPHSGRRVECARSGYELTFVERADVPQAVAVRPEVADVDRHRPPQLLLERQVPRLLPRGLDVR